MSKTVRRTLCCLLSVLVAAAAMVMPSVYPSATDDTQLSDDEQADIDSLREQQQALENKIAQANDAIAALNSKAEQKEEYVNELTGQVNNYQEQIDVVNQSIAVLETRIAELDARIAELDAKIAELEERIADNNTKIVDSNQLMEDTYAQLCERLREMYMYGESTTLEMLMQAESFSAFLIRLELASGIAKHDSALIESIKEAIAEIEKLNAEIKESEAQLESDKAEIEVSKTEVEADRAEVEASRATLQASKNKVDSLLNEALSYIDSLDRESDSFSALVNEYESQIAEFDREIEQIIANAASSGSGTVNEVDGMICPLQSADRYISSGYGYRGDPISGVYKFHYGLDICSSSGTYGKSIVAAASGKVIISTYHPTSGNYIAIDHGDGVVTVYCHCSELLVSVGTAVSQGQTIAYAGASGYVTGAHLHFEVRINSTRVDPSGYITV